MANAVIMPKLGATMDQGRIVRWIAGEGDQIKKGMPLFEVESDKSILEIESNYDGILLKILHFEDEDVPVLQTIGIIGKPGEDISGFSDQGSSVKEPSAAEGPTAEVQYNVHNEEAQSVRNTEIKSTPAAKRAAKMNGIDLRQVKPNEHGVITDKEVEAFVHTEQARVEKTHAAQQTQTAQADDMYLNRLLYSIGTPAAVPSGQKRQKLGGIRKVIAEKMTEAWRVPMAGNIVEVDVTAALKLCEELNTRIADSGIRINITDVLLKVIAYAVRQNPGVNAYLDGDAIFYRDEVNVGIAVALDNGLIVPVLHNADKKGLIEINKEKRDLASRARVGKLESGETNGGSITLTNMGAYGIEIPFPILNIPEICIVGTGKITKKPVVINDEIVIRPMMWVTLIYDHRLLDGVPSANLLNTIREMIEMPELMIR